MGKNSKKSSLLDAVKQARDGAKNFFKTGSSSHTSIEGNTCANAPSANHNQVSLNSFWCYTKRPSYGSFNSFSLFRFYDKQIIDLIAEFNKLKKLPGKLNLQKADFQPVFNKLDDIYLNFIANGALHVFCLVHAINAAFKCEGDNSFMKEFFEYYIAGLAEEYYKKNLNTYCSDEDIDYAEECSDLNHKKMQLITELGVTKNKSLSDAKAPIYQKIESIDRTIADKRLKGLSEKIFNVCRLVDELKPAALSQNNPVTIKPTK